MWNEIENSMKRRNNGQWFKLDADDQARIVILTDPEAIEKDGHFGAWTAYSIEIYNADEDCLQTWEMGGSAVRGLIEIKKPMGLALVVSSVLKVQRKGTGKDTRYSWQRDRAIDSTTADSITALGGRVHDDCEITTAKAAPKKRKAAGNDPIPF